jgi:uncharacterized protein YutE (UPF0331/DUF86 family)
MKPLKIKKIAVQAKSRALKATWTLEAVQDTQSYYDINVEAELSKILQEEIDKEFLKTLNWVKVPVRNWQKVDDDWCKRYIKGKYKSFGNFWMFECEKDAHFFMLKWGTI